MTITPDLYLQGDSTKWKNWQAMYINVKTCEDCRPKKHNLSEVLPKKMIGGNIFKNKRNLLPEKEGRIWYEADFDYVSGYRNTHRILYSNDGLIFISYDHAQTFYELVK